MNGQRSTLPLLLIAVSCCVGIPIASSQKLSDQWVEQAARPLVDNRVADGLSVGYIEGQHYGIVHLGSSNRAGKKADNLTVYEIGSVSKVFTSLLLADAVVRGEIDLNAAADVANGAGIRLPSRDGMSIKWIDLSSHRTGLPKLPGNLLLTNPTNPYRDYDSKQAAAFLNQYELPRKPGERARILQLRRVRSWLPGRGEGWQELRSAPAGANRGAATNDGLHRFTEHRSKETVGHAA